MFSFMVILTRLPNVYLRPIQRCNHAQVFTQPTHGCVNVSCRGVAAGADCETSTGCLTRCRGHHSLHTIHGSEAISQPPFPLKRCPLSFCFTSACPARKQMAASSAHMTHDPNQRIHSLPMPELLLGLAGVRRPLQCVVEQQLFDQVHVRHEHAPAAIPHQAQRIQRISAQGRKISLGDAWSQGRAWDDSIAWRRRGCQSIHMI